MIIGRTDMSDMAKHLLTLMISLFCTFMNEESDILWALERLSLFRTHANQRLDDL